MIQYALLRQTFLCILLYCDLDKKHKSNKWQSIENEETGKVLKDTRKEIQKLECILQLNREKVNIKL